MSWLPVTYKSKQCVNLIIFEYINEKFPSQLNEVFDVVTENNFQLKDSFQKTKFPCKTNNGQFALPHIDLTFRIETPGTLQRTNSFNPFKYKLKKHFSNELKNSNNFF